MHSDLLLLRVACRVVEGDKRRATSPSAAAATTADAADAVAVAMPRIVLPALALPPSNTPAPRDNRRIPSITSHMPHVAPSLATHAADLMLGLKRRTGKRAGESAQHERDAPAAVTKRLRADPRSPRESEPMRVRLPTPPGVFVDSPLAALVSAHRPPPTRSPLGVEGVAVPSPQDDKSQAKAAPTTFMAFISQHNQVVLGDDRRRQDAPSDSDSDDDMLSPLESPRPDRTSTTSLRVPAIPPWRVPVLLHGSPQLQCSPLPPMTSCRQMPMPPLSLSASTKPTLVRKSSAPWRQTMAAQDREKTRERILRGLHRQSQGDLDTLLELVTAMEEELLHLHTTSKEHYFVQTTALRDRIASVSPPRTALPSRRPEP